MLFPLASVTCLGWCRCAPCRHHVAEELAVLKRWPAWDAARLMRIRHPPKPVEKLKPEPLTINRRGSRWDVLHVMDPWW